MATNVTLLLARLRDYHETLRGQTLAVDAAHAGLKNRFARLWSVYTGQNAERFQAHWRKTSAGIDACMETSRRLERFLAQSIAALEKAEKSMQL